MHRALKLKNPWYLLGLASVIILGIDGCAQLSPTRLGLFSAPVNQAVATPQGNTAAPGVPTSAVGLPAVQPGTNDALNSAPATAVSSARTPVPAVRTAPVGRGSIADVLLLNGRVAGLSEAPLAFTTRGTVGGVYVQAGQRVTQGQILVDADSAQQQKDLAAARSKADAAAQALQKGQEQAAQAQRQASDRRDSAVADAQTRLTQAQNDLDKVRAGAPDLDRQTADAAVLLAQSNLDRAQTDLGKLTAPPDPNAVRAAQQQFAAAQVGLQTAQADQAKLKAGGAPTAVRAAERALADAKAAQLAAQTDFDRLTQGPDPFELRAAERAVQQAQANVSAAASAPQKDTAVASANLALLGAQDSLARLKQPPSTAAVQLAQSKLDDAKSAVVSAQENLDALRTPPSQLALDKAQGLVDSAQLTLDNAKAALAVVQGGAPADQIQNAQKSVEAAKLALTSAQTRHDEVYGHPTPAELRDAQARVDTAQQALSKAGAVVTDSGGPDLGPLKQAVDDTSAQLQDALSAVEATHLRAPADAIVAQVLLQLSDAIEPAKPAVVLSQSADPIVRVNLLDGDKPKRVEVGQKVSVQLDGSDTKFDGQTAGFAQPASNGDRVAVVSVNWGSARPTIGTGARVSITVAQKDNALLVPRRAVKSTGNRTYVEVPDGAVTKTVQVEVGISSATDVEIVSGLTEGQTIVLDSVLQAPSDNAPLPAPAATPNATSSVPDAVGVTVPAQDTTAAP